MEILKGDTTTAIKFPVPSTVSVATYVVKKGDRNGSVSNAAIENGVASCTLPYFAVQSEGKVNVTLNFNEGADQYSVEKKVDVVTPYLELWEVREILPNASERDLVLAESAARHVIEAHCNQSFGFEKDVVKQIQGAGKYLESERRIIRLTAINDKPYNIPINGYVFYFGDQWIGVKQAPDEAIAQEIIQYPYLGQTRFFDPNQVYNVRGDFGYEEIPSAVKDSMMELISQYGCYDDTYRKKYLESLASADYRITYNSEVWAGTGNADVDMLLEEYVRKDWIVV